MKICVAGWDYQKDYLWALRQAHKEFDVIIINHRPELPAAVFNGIVLISIENIGLEFGCYDYFLKTCWDGKSNVLFTHDDMRVDDPSVFKKISQLDDDQAYIWRDKAERVANGGKHGRAIFCSARFLNFILDWECNCPKCNGKRDNKNKRLLKGTGPHRGFWFDPHNTGHTTGTPPNGVRHYNDAIYHFHWMLGRIRDRKVGPQTMWPNPEGDPMFVVQHRYFPGFEAGRRNTWDHINREKARYGDDSKVGKAVNSKS